MMHFLKNIDPLVNAMLWTFLIITLYRIERKIEDLRIMAKVKPQDLSQHPIPKDKPDANEIAKPDIS